MCKNVMFGKTWVNIDIYLLLIVPFGTIRQKSATKRVPETNLHTKKCIYMQQDCDKHLRQGCRIFVVYCILQ